MRAAKWCIDGNEFSHADTGADMGNDTSDAQIAALAIVAHGSAQVETLLKTSFLTISP